jgi:hypothetical protein
MAAFIAIMAASRLPLLGGGYGSDDDSWRNIVAALRMRELGHYVPSRAPGFPVFESLLALLAPYGWLLTNGATALAGIVAAVIFHRLAVRLKVNSPGWLSLGFAFCSGLWITTCQTMDYAYGLAFMLAAYLALLGRRHLWAGILLALAAGCRVTLGAQLLGMVALLLTRREPVRAWVALLGGFAAVLGLLFLPVVRSPDLADIGGQAAYHVSRAHLTLRTFMPITRAALVFTFGRFGLSFLALAGIVVALEFLRRSQRDGLRRRLERFELGPVTYELIAISVCLGSFILMPYEKAYLLPAVPFVLLLAGRVLRPAWIGLLAAVLVVEPLATVSLGGARVVPGQFFVERAQRRADLAESRELAALQPGSPTVYMVGRFRVHRLLILEPSLERMGLAWRSFYGPGVALWRPDHHVGCAQMLLDSQRDSLERQGYQVAAWSAGTLPGR